MTITPKEAAALAAHMRNHASLWKELGELYWARDDAADAWVP